MKLDDAILEELERGGPDTVKGISDRLSRRVYDALERLARANQVVKAGYPGKGNEKRYSLPKPGIVVTRRLGDAAR